MLAPSPSASGSLGLLMNEPRDLSPSMATRFVHRGCNCAHIKPGHRSFCQARCLDALIDMLTQP